jgi:hypothetical protein
MDIVVLLRLPLSYQTVYCVDFRVWIIGNFNLVPLLKFLFGDVRTRSSCRL